MKKFLFLVLSVILVTAVAAYADDGQDEGKLSFWEKLRKKIEMITPKKDLPVTTAVGGVRGLQTESAENLYWKDAEHGIEASEEELEIFKAAVQFAEEGRREQARGIFEQFIQNFPDSQLLDDARQAVSVLQSELDASDGSGG